MKLKFSSLFILIIVLIPDILFGQSGTPYSRFGIGDPVYSYSARRFGMGQLGVAVTDNNFISVLNPASWVNIDLVRTDLAIHYSGTFLRNTTANTYYGDLIFNGFTFAIPISTKYGISSVLGIIPYSIVSYKTVENYTPPDPSIDNYSITYEGRGGLNKLFLGGSYRTPLGVNFGASFDYYFGDNFYDSNVEFISSNNLNTQYERKFNLKGFGTTVGIISQDLSKVFGIGAISDFKAGVSVGYIGKLSVDSILTGTSSLGIDTVFSSKGKMKIPMRYNFGISFDISKKYLVYADYLIQPWSQLEIGNTKYPNIRNANKISAGFEYTPERSSRSNFWEQIIWRAGLSYEQTQYIIENSGINQYSISGGFSLPLSQKNSLDVGLQYTTGGKTELNIFKKNTVEINLGLSLGEIWFLRFQK
jgi:hypothetical protein